jgi:carbon monoxide dehydrogenase subunit G
MKFENEFTVPAPVEATWQTLLDVERVATCLPGAAIERAAEDGVYRGAMRVKVGPVAMRYQGTVRLIDIDEDVRTATFEARGNEAGGSGTAAAVIRNTLSPAGDGTMVSVETELKVTGRAAQFGRGIMQDIAGSMMEQFASELERLIVGGDTAPEAARNGAAVPPARSEPAAAAPAQPGPAASSKSDDGPAALEVGGAIGQALARRAAPAAAAAGVLALLGLLFAGRRRRRPSVTFRVRL